MLSIISLKLLICSCMALSSSECVYSSAYLVVFLVISWVFDDTCCSCLPEMLGMSPRLVDCGLLWKVKLGSWIVWFGCHCHGRFPLFPSGCPFYCFRVPKSMQIFRWLAHVRCSSFHCAYCPRNISRKPKSRWVRGRCDSHPARGREGLGLHMLLK